MTDTPEKKFNCGDAVILMALPQGFIDDMDLEDRQALSEVIGSQAVFKEFDEIGRAKLQFTSRDGHLHFIWVEREFIRAAD